MHVCFTPCNNLFSYINYTCICIIIYVLRPVFSLSLANTYHRLIGWVYIPDAGRSPTFEYNDKRISFQFRNSNFRQTFRPSPFYTNSHKSRRLIRDLSLSDMVYLGLAFNVLIFYATLTFAIINLTSGRLFLIEIPGNQVPRLTKTVKFEARITSPLQHTDRFQEPPGHVIVKIYSPESRSRDDKNETLAKRNNAIVLCLIFMQTLPTLCEIGKLTEIIQHPNNRSERLIETFYCIVSCASDTVFQSFNRKRWNVRLSNEPRSKFMDSIRIGTL